MTNDALKTVLERLSQSEDSPVAAIAHAFSQAPDFAADTVLETLSSLAAGRGGLEQASSLVSALLSIDKAIAAACPEKLPFATRLAPFCAQRLLHAALETAAEETQGRLAQSCPIVQIGRKTLLAAPVELASREAVARFFDRIIPAARDSKANKVVLLWNRPLAGSFEAELAELRRELEAVGAQLVIRGTGVDGH